MSLKNIAFAASALVLIWSAVGAIMKATDKHTSTPEKVVALMSETPWIDGADVAAAARKKHLDEVIANVNRLDFEQRREMREADRPVNQRFFESLTAAERRRFLEETVEAHFKSVMKAFNSMDREERQRRVNQALRDMERNGGRDKGMEKLRQEDEQVFERVVEKGLGAYYQDASAETKLDLAPLMERMQQRLRGFGNH